MVTELGLLYLGGFTILFFFWLYGIVAFVRDLKRTILPGIRAYLAERGDGNEETDEERTELY